MGSGIIDEPQWARTAEGKVALRLIEQWKTGLTEQGDIVLGFTSTMGNDPATAAGEASRLQFICTRDDALEIARTILRAIAFSEPSAYSKPTDSSAFAAFRDRIRSPMLRAMADDWNQARGKRRMPSWNEINPGITAPYLGSMWGFDRDRASGEFIGRLAGSHILQTFCRNFLGTPLRDLHHGHVFEVAHASLTRAVSAPACCRFSGKLFRTGGKLVAGERLLLPIGADPMRPDGVLGASCYGSYTPSRPPAPIEPLRGRPDWCPV